MDIDLDFDSSQFDKEESLTQSVVDNVPNNATSNPQLSINYTYKSITLSTKLSQNYFYMGISKTF